MAVLFKASDHSYKSIDQNENINWMSVTKFVSLFKPKFDAIATSIKVSKNKKSKWYGMDPEVIRDYWEQESKRAVDTGSFYHDQRESDLLSHDTLQREGVQIPIIKPIIEGEYKYAPAQRLTEGIYPEHFVFLKSAGLCGQSDRVEVVKGVIDVIDYKTNKEIKTEGFRNWKNETQKMLGPCSHLDDCNYNHYALQLSTYMYIMLKHNPQYDPGQLMLHHVIFEKEGDDKLGYPILKYDDNNHPIVAEIVPYEVPYLRDEVISMINYIKENDITKA